MVGSYTSMLQSEHLFMHSSLFFLLRSPKELNCQSFMLTISPLVNAFWSREQSFMLMMYFSFPTVQRLKISTNRLWERVLLILGENTGRLCAKEFFWLILLFNLFASKNRWCYLFLSVSRIYSWTTDRTIIWKCLKVKKFCCLFLRKKNKPVPV